MEGNGSEPWGRPAGWVPPPGAAPGTEGGPPDPWAHDAVLYGQPVGPASRVRGGRWGIGAAVSLGMVGIGLPLWIVLAIWYGASLPPPPPEGDGPQEAWYLMAFMFGFVVWTVAWLVLAFLCGVIASVQAARSRRAQVAPPSVW